MTNSHTGCETYLKSRTGTKKRPSNEPPIFSASVFELLTVEIVHKPVDQSLHVLNYHGIVLIVVCLLAFSLFFFGSYFVSDCFAGVVMIHHDVFDIDGCSVVPLRPPRGRGFPLGGFYRRRSSVSRREDPLDSGMQAHASWPLQLVMLQQHLVLRACPT